jgi:hypothetical protein
MFKKINFRRTLVAGSIAALLFCIPAYIFIKQAEYKQSWILFLGSSFFLVVMAINTYLDIKKRGGDESTVTMVFAAHMATLAGVLIACIICFILLAVMVPGYLVHGIPGKVLADVPPNAIEDKTNGLSFQLFMAATIINFAGGSFAGITIPFYAKNNQTRNSKAPKAPRQKGMK